MSTDLRVRNSWGFKETPTFSQAFTSRDSTRFSRSTAKRDPLRMLAEEKSPLKYALTVISREKALKSLFSLVGKAFLQLQSPLTFPFYLRCGELRITCEDHSLCTHNCLIKNWDLIIGLSMLSILHTLPTTPTGLWCNNSSLDLKKLQDIDSIWGAANGEIQRLEGKQK